jgi:hypothetical protein
MRSEKRCKVVFSESFNDVLDDEIDELVLQHRLRVEVGDQERNIVSLSPRHQIKQHRHQH